MSDVSQPPNVSIAARLVASGSVFFLLALASVVARLYTRFQTSRLGTDDYSIATAMACGIALYTVTLIGVCHGLGRHVVYLDPKSVSLNAVLEVLATEFYVWSATIAKISIACMLLRIQYNRTWRYGLYVMIIFQIVVAIACNVIDHIKCAPSPTSWKLPSRHSPCVTAEAYQIWVYAGSSFFLATDLIYSMLPICIITKIQRPIRERIVVCVLMALGLLATLAVVPKFLALGSLSGSDDSTWFMSDLRLWSLIEVYIGITAACLPPLKIVLEKMLINIGVLHSSHPRLGKAESGVGPLVEKQKMGSFSMHLSTSDEASIDRGRNTAANWNSPV